jgi:hypothetical protein
MRVSEANQLIDKFLPSYDVRSEHSLLVRAPAERAYAAWRSLDMGRSALIRSLFRLRELPMRLANPGYQGPGLGFTFDDFLKIGFIPLGDNPPQEILLGLVGRVWTLKPDIRQLAPEGFLAFDRPGYVKVAANLAVSVIDRETSLLSTETRVLCLGPGAARRFGLYWALIKPFSGLIRREWLKLVKREAEDGG